MSYGVVDLDWRFDKVWSRLVRRRVGREGSVRTTMDLHRLKHFVKYAPDYMMVNPDRESLDPAVPYLGLRDYWYPIMEDRTLGTSNGATRTVMLRGQQHVLERGPRGMVRSRCGDCVVEVRYGIIWLYAGNGDPPLLDESYPHLAEIMRGPWRRVSVWDYPVSYLNILDNKCDPLHVSFAHRGCVQGRDQREWDTVHVDRLPCGGLKMGLRGEGPPHRGPRHIDEYEIHLPGYTAFPCRPGEDQYGSMQIAVPVDLCEVRQFRLSSYGGALRSRVMAYSKNFLFLSKFGMPNNIYYCNWGSDQPLCFTQGRIADWGKERLMRGDKPILAFRRMMMRAYANELGRPDPFDKSSRRRNDDAELAGDIETSEPASRGR